MFLLFATDVSTTPAANCYSIIDTDGKFAIDINTNGTSRKFATSVIDTGGKLSLILVVDLDLQISLRIFEKIRNDPNIIFIGFGEDDSWKKPKT